MAKFVPLISSNVAGPLGVVHLPRLWSKVLLCAKGLLPEGYDECGKGFDQMVLDGLRLNRETALQYLKGNLPSYPAFEKWVVEQRGGHIDSAEIKAVNAAIRGYHHADETRKAILSAAGIEDDGSIKDAVRLNTIDDWTEFHATLTGK